MIAAAVFVSLTNLKAERQCRNFLSLSEDLDSSAPWLIPQSLRMVCRRPLRTWKLVTHTFRNVWIFRRQLCSSASMVVMRTSVILQECAEYIRIIQIAH